MKKHKPRKSIFARRRNLWRMDYTKQGELFDFSCYAKDSKTAVHRAKSIHGDIKIHTIEKVR